jgi:hypothetical protein
MLALYYLGSIFSKPIMHRSALFGEILAFSSCTL